MAANVLTSTLKVLVLPIPHGLLTVQSIFWLLPMIALPVAVAITVVVPCPEFITQPTGKAQVYRVAPFGGPLRGVTV
jgi:hypothetical protein